MTYSEIIKKLKSQSNPKNVAGMARFGINPKNTLGISIPYLRALAKKIGKNHILAQKLWDSKIHEARILASLVGEIEKLTPSQMDKWIRDFDSWDVCDQVCMNLFRWAPCALKKCFEWAGRAKEFEKRAGFALMAAVASGRKDIEDKEFIKFLAVIKKAATDERNFVRKAVNWALRNIGKRNKNLNKVAIKVAREIAIIDNKTARWIAGDALRELMSPVVIKRLK